MKDTHRTIGTISEIGIFAAIGYVLDELQGLIGKGIFINGGSIGFAMVAVMIISIRRGWLSGVLAGLIIGLFDFATGAYILHPIQAMLDYILPYAFVGLAGLLVPLYNKSKKKILWLCVIAIVGGLAKFLSHYLAGVIFWTNSAGFAWGLNGLNPFIYSAIYNIAFIGPSIVLCIPILILLYKRASMLLTSQDPLDKEKSQTEKTKGLSYALSGTFMTGGTFLFIWYLIKFIKSVETYTDEYESESKIWEVFGFEADGDSMVIFILGLFLATLGVYVLIKTIRNIINESKIMVNLGAIAAIAFLYGLFRLIKCYVKAKPVATYWYWVIISAVVLIAITTVAIMLKSKHQEEIDVDKIEDQKDQSF